MTDPVQSAQSFNKKLFPTATVALAVLAIDIYFILKVGRSPIFLTVEELGASLNTDMFYTLVLITLTFLFWIAPLVLLVIGANILAYKLVAWPFKRCRYLRLAAAFSRRNTISADHVRAYAKRHERQDIIDEIRKREKSRAVAAVGVPFAILVSTILLVSLSSPQRPNFIMRVCGNEVPVDLCNSYWLFVILICLQAFLLMALNGSTILTLTRMKPSEFGLKMGDIKKHLALDPGVEGMARAQRRWFGRARVEEE